MILAIYDYIFAEDRTFPIYYRGMRVTVKVMDLEELKIIPAYFTFTVRSKDDFEMDLCEVIADRALQIANRAMVAGDILRATKSKVVEILEDDTEQDVIEYFVPILDYLDKNFIQYFGRAGYFLPPIDRLSDNSVWGQYADFLMDSSETWHIGEAINKIIWNEEYKATIDLLVKGEGPFRKCYLNPNWYDQESYASNILKKYGGEIVNRRVGIREMNMIKFPNHFKYREWLINEVKATIELPVGESKFLQNRKEVQWKNAKKKKEVGW